MKAKVTDRHTLFIDQAPASTGKVTPEDPHLTPGTWGSWLLDERGTLVPGSQFELGFGKFDEDDKRTAYEKSANLLDYLGRADGLLPFENLQ